MKNGQRENDEVADIVDALDLVQNFETKVLGVESKDCSTSGELKLLMLLALWLFGGLKMMILLTLFKKALGINNEEKRALWHLGAKILESDFEKTRSGKSSKIRRKARGTL